MSEERYIQREISWNAFNRRVMSEGCREDLPLLDRLKFMAITSSNYDEFFMVRVARLMRDTAAGAVRSEVLENLLSDIHDVVEIQSREVRDIILPQMAREGIAIIPPEEWGVDENRKADTVFEHELLAACTPIGITRERTLNNVVFQARIYAAFLLDDGHLAVVRVPLNLKRFRISSSDGQSREMLLLEDILLTRGQGLFPGRKITASCLFRITRDADMTVDEERDEDFVAAMEEVLESRKDSFPVRLETRGDSMLAGKLREDLNLPEANHFSFTAPLDLKGFFDLVFLPGFDHLRSNPVRPKPAEDLADSEDLWEVLRERDVLLHHPYESYAPVVRMVEEAAEDPATLAIKMTLYRTSGDSPIAKALIRAAERGVQVTVLVELKARFDEGANILWAEKLQKAGAIVIHGLAVLKVHAKALMVVRREDDGIHRYVHLGTGNYNDSTAKLYTDMGLMTSREEYTRETALFFNAITGYSSEPQLSILAMAPFSLRRETLALIRREEERAREGEEARIVAKMNSLVDPEIIDALYAASEAGVKVDLNVRGSCCLIPGVPGLSDNIRVISVIDSFLEHTRAFAYYNGGHQEVFLSSADWMTRNLDRRVELLFPILDAGHRHRIIAALESYFRDNTQAWKLAANGDWSRVTRKKGEPRFRVQEEFAERTAARAASRDDEEKRALRVRRNPTGRVS